MGIEIKGLLKQRESLLKGIDNKEGQDKDDAISLLKNLERQIEENINNFLEDLNIDYDRSSDVSTSLKIEEIDTQFPYSELSDDQKEKLIDLLGEFKIIVEDPDKTDQDIDSRKAAIISQKEWNGISIPKEVNKIVKRRANAFHPIDFWIARDNKGRFLFIYDMLLKHVSPLQRVEGILSEIKRVSENRQQVIITLLENDNFDIFCKLCTDLLLSTKNFKRNDQEENFDFISKKIANWNLKEGMQNMSVLQLDSLEPQVSYLMAASPVSSDDFVEEIFDTDNNQAENLTKQIFDFFKFSNSPKPSEDLLMRFIDDKVSYSEQLQMNHLIETDAELRIKIRDIKEADNIFDMVIEESGIDISKSDNPIEDSIEILKIKKKKKDNLNQNKLPGLADKLRDLIPKNGWDLSIFGKSFSLGSEAVFSGAALASVGFFALVNIYQVNSPVYQMMLNASLYPDQNILYNSVKTGDTLTSQEMIAIANKGSIEDYTTIKDFDKNFQVIIKNDDNRETYKLENKGYIKNGRKIQFSFKSPIEGILDVKLIDVLGGISKVPGFQSIEIKKDQQVSIGSKPLIAKTSIGQELLQIKIENSEGIFLGNFFFTTINTNEFEEKLQKIKLVKSAEANSTSSKYMEVYKKAFTQKLSNFEIYSWVNERTNTYYTDYDNNKIADLVAVKNRDKDTIDYFILDRNLNQKADTIVYPFKNNNIVSFIWQTDANEDGLIDEVGFDYDGDWLVDKISKI